MCTYDLNRKAVWLHAAHMTIAGEAYHYNIIMVTLACKRSIYTFIEFKCVQINRPSPPRVISAQPSQLYTQYSEPTYI